MSFSTAARRSAAKAPGLEVSWQEWKTWANGKWFFGAYEKSELDKNNLAILSFKFVLDGDFQALISAYLRIKS